jgi:hypothetical protein
MSHAKPFSARAMYQLKMSLRDNHPPIWRRIRVASDITLATLYRILQKDSTSEEEAQTRVSTNI